MISSIELEERNMQEGELFYRFKRILNLMQCVGKIFLGTEGWKEFQNISQIFIKRFSASTALLKYQ